MLLNSCGGCEGSRNSTYVIRARNDTMVVELCGSHTSLCLPHIEDGNTCSHSSLEKAVNLIENLITSKGSL